MNNKVVFISGASRGIGESLANYFVEKNYYVEEPLEMILTLKINLKIYCQLSWT